MIHRETTAMNAPLRATEAAALAAFATQRWDEAIVPALTDYIAVPAKSPMFDPDWAAHGYLDRVVHDAAAWVESRKVPGLTLEVIRLLGLLVEVAVHQHGLRHQG